MADLWYSDINAMLFLEYNDQSLRVNAVSLALLDQSLHAPPVEVQNYEIAQEYLHAVNVEEDLQLVLDVLRVSSPIN